MTATRMVRPVMTRLESVTVTPRLATSARSPRAAPTPATRPSNPPAAPTTTASPITEANTWRPVAPAARRRASSRNRWVTIIENVLAMRNAPNEERSPSQDEQRQGDVLHLSLRRCCAGRRGVASEPDLRSGCPARVGCVRLRRWGRRRRRRPRPPRRSRDRVAEGGGPNGVHEGKGAVREPVAVAEPDKADDGEGTGGFGRSCTRSPTARWWERAVAWSMTTSPRCSGACPVRSG